MMTYTFQEFQGSSLSKKPHYTVIGHPVSHSLSPLMHQTALDYYDFDASYVAVDVNPSELSSFIAWCNQPYFLGSNITIPFKQELYNIPDHIHSDAKQIGAINTLAKEDGRLFGHNTDIFGFLQPLQPYLNDIKQNRVILFGTGGASRAVVFALQQIGVKEIILVSRRPESSGPVHSHNVLIRTVGYSEWQAYAEEAILFVNATPVGMYPNIDQLFIDEHDIDLMSGKICYDLIYNPLQTSFIKKAKDIGAETINGLEMLIHQGSKSFEIWTGKPFPVDLIKQKLKKHFETNF